MCYDSDKLVNLLLTYKNEQTQTQQSIFLTAFVAENSPIDLIIGRSSIKKHNFTNSTPSHFGSNSQNKNSAVSTVFSTKPYIATESVTLKSGMKKTRTVKIPVLSTTNACLCGLPHPMPKNLDLVTEE